METKKKLEKASDKVSQICHILRDEALEPARKEADTIIEEAKNRANQVVREAEEQAKQIIDSAKRSSEQEKTVFQSSMLQASKQSLEALRQSIENRLFNEELESVIAKNSADPKVIGQLINAICTALDKEGIGANIIAEIPHHVSPQAVNALLLESIVKRLKDKSVTVGNFRGGAQVKIVDKQMKIDLSEHALKELLSHYLRKDFRKTIFEA